MKKIIRNILVSTFLIAIKLNAMQIAELTDAAIFMRLKKRYSLSLFESPHISNCFALDPSNTIIFTKKRLCYHLFAQASQDKNFNLVVFRDLISEIGKSHEKEDRIADPYIQIMQVASFHTLFQYIPWNGKIDDENGFIYHETLLNDHFANIGVADGLEYKAAQKDMPLVISIFSNNEDDFDCDCDHRDNIEKAFEKLYQQH